jgi:hypothetical protein
MGSHFHGPLRTHPTNPRYFTDDRGDAIYLTGSHTWAVIQETTFEGQPDFPFDEFLEMVSDHGHNFVRLWVWEQTERASWTDERVIFDPLPWARTGPGLAIDGLPKFDLGAWNESYFQRLRDRCMAFGRSGIYVSVMLFQGWSLPKKDRGGPSDPFPFHPFNAANNINGVGPDFDGRDDDTAPSLHSLHNQGVLDMQEKWIRKVIDTVNDLDHVLYEVINEGGSLEWQYHVVDYVKDYEATKPAQHPIGITHRIDPPHNNIAMFDSAADWVSPAVEPRYAEDLHAQPVYDYRNDPPVADGTRVSIVDTDHIWGHGGNPYWVWKCFMRGHNPIFMDPWWPLYVNSKPEVTEWAFVGQISKDDRDFPDWEPTRHAMGDTLRYASRVDLGAMSPRPDLASSRYCLANPGVEYLIYLPEGGSISVDVSESDASYLSEWFVPRTGQVYPGLVLTPLEGYVVTTAPVTADAVLYLCTVHQ